MATETTNKLLIRIDERQHIMSDDIKIIKAKLDFKVDDNKDYCDMKDKVYKMWDDRNKMLGYMIGAGVAGGGISTFLAGAVKAILAYF